jgi:hypothetical protein
MTTELGERFYDMYRRLKNREAPLYVSLEKKQWDQLDRTFAEKMEAIELQNLPKHLHASNNRGGVIALRLTSIFTVLRAFEDDPDRMNLEETLIPSTEDFQAGLQIARNFVEHAIRLYHLLPEAQAISDSRGERFIQFYENLPEEFETNEAVETGENCEIEVPERTVKDWLGKDDGKFIRVKKGHYRKGV